MVNNSPSPARGTMMQVIAAKGHPLHRRIRQPANFYPPGRRMWIKIACVARKQSHSIHWSHPKTAAILN
jgi:hypothetical protein